MRSSIRVSLVVGALIGAAAMTCANAGSARELLFSAPVQQLDRGSDMVTVLGQRFNAPTAAQLSVGEVVDVYGTLNKDGSITNAAVEGTGAFSANGDPVFMKGMVTGTDAILGHVTIDGMTVDYTPVLSNPNFVAPSVGDVIAVAGSQPAQQGVLVATATGDGAYVAGISGGAASFAGVSASGLNGASSNEGAKVAGMSGGGFNSAGMSGGGFNSAGMSGGGFNSAGMSGGGFNSAGMSGGGFNSAGMSGGGFNSAGMSGGGFNSAGMSGGGFNSAGMSGGGFNSAGMSGGGFNSAGMSGGGLRAAAATGGSR